MKIAVIGMGYVGGTTDIVIDGRNLYKTKRMLELGYKYDSMGRPIRKI